MGRRIEHDQADIMLARLRLPGLMCNLAACVRDAAIEEMRVRMALGRMAKEYRQELAAAGRFIPAGGRRG